MTRRLVVALGVLLLAACSGAASDEGVARDYRITYEVTTDGATTTEVHTVRRPFLGRVDIGGATRVTDLGVLATASAGSPWVRIEVPIAPAIGDLRADALLGDASVSEGESREIAGRACRVLQVEAMDVCVDDDGLVLWQREEGRTMEAVDVQVGDVDDGDFEIPDVAELLSFRQGGGSVKPVADNEDHGFAERWQLDAPPSFEHAGRFAVLPPLLGTTVDPLVPRRADVALVTDVYVDGADLLIVDQGAALDGGAPPWDDRPATRTVRLSLGRAQLIVDVRMSEVRITRPDGGFVRVAGTLPPSRLVEIARTLEVEG